MTTTLYSLGIIPLAQPYNTTPWNYEGTESVVAIPNSNIVDWVLLELRETTGDVTAATPATMVSRKAGFILKDGTIVSTNGSSPVNFSVSVTNNLFLVIYHRNHLGIISSLPVPMVSDSYVYDFSTSVDKAFGGFNGHKEIAPGIWGMASGDGRCDGEINNQDKNDVWKIQNGNSGYLPGDLNLDGQVNMNDKTVYWKLNSGKCSMIIK
jgi:hypothetical protein